MEEKKSKLVYVKWLSVFILLFAAVGTERYYDIEVEIYVEGSSLNTGDVVDAYGTGYYWTNYCRNNFIDCMYYAEIDPTTKNIRADYRIKQEYSAEQLLAFYRQGLDLQERLIDLYQQMLDIVE